MAYLCFAYNAPTVMLTRYVLTINGAAYVLQDDDLRNWDEISCSLKRSSLDGIVRTFTSQFEFVNQAYDLMLSAYLSEGINAKASIKVLTINDVWTYDLRFECSLDFSTISWESGILKINSLDNGLEAVVKANKSTSYEMPVGECIVPDRTLVFDRVEMTESLVYGFTYGEQSEDSAAITISLAKGERIWVGNKGSEIAVGGHVAWEEDQTDDEGSYALQARRDLAMNFNYDITFRNTAGHGSIDVSVRILRKGEVLPVDINALNGNGGQFAFLGNNGKVYVNEKLGISNFSSYAQLYTACKPESDNLFALVNNVIWETRYKGNTQADGYTCAWENTGKTWEVYTRSRISGTMKLNLIAGDKVFFDAVAVHDAGKKAMACILSSEMTFSWQAIGDTVEIDAFTPYNVLTALVRKMAGDERECAIKISGLDERLAGTYLIPAESARGLDGAKFQTSFNDFSDWMSAVFGYVCRIDGNTLEFVHRSELFASSASPIIIEDAADVSYSVDSSSIYSSVTVGYEKKDYDSVNGRDEFNFNNTYSTGCTLSDKKLSLLSKYRADSYGLEFAVQKRGEDSTDTSSDKDVFFILCAAAGDNLIPDRSIPIENVLSPTLFNGAFSPMACARANAGYIGLQAPGLVLSFASAAGNTDAVVDGEAMDSNLVLGSPIATCGCVEFTTGNVDEPANVDGLFELAENGITYRGYLKEADFKYACAEAVKYKLIVKEVVS